jgi:hypothetical protein
MSLDMKSLNKNLHNYFFPLEKELNKKVIQRGEPGPGWLFYKPTITKVGGYQKIPRYSDQAFSLVSPQPALADKIIKPEDINSILIRRTIGYRAAMRMSEKNANLHEILGPLTEEMLITLKSAVGFGPEIMSWGTTYATFKRPGSEEEYIRLVEDSNELEIRLFSDVLPVLELE